MYKLISDDCMIDQKIFQALKSERTDQNPDVRFFYAG
jgi:hypothetical protein